jgi:lysophospholipase L1-like esterase
VTDPIPPIDETGPLRLALLGDSISYGVGADRTADTLAPRLRADLEDDGVGTVTRVFGWPGARSTNLRRQVERALSWEPDVALIIIGANDLTHQVPPAQAAEELRRAVRGLTSAGVEVVLAPAPDLSVVPHVPPGFRELVRNRSLELRRMQIEAATGEGAVVADADAATSSSFETDLGLFSSDRFHPSSAGYARIASGLAPVVRGAALRSAAARRRREGPATPR